MQLYLFPVCTICTIPILGERDIRIGSPIFVYWCSKAQDIDINPSSMKSHCLFVSFLILSCLLYDIRRDYRLCFNNSWNTTHSWHRSFQTLPSSWILSKESTRSKVGCFKQADFSLAGRRTIVLISETFAYGCFNAEYPWDSWSIVWSQNVFNLLLSSFCNWLASHQWIRR